MRRFARRLAAVLSFLATACGLAGTTGAETLFEKLVMPGEVIEGHAKFEKDCGKCHESFAKTGQNRLCLDCHKPVAADLTAKSGFHGKHPTIKDTECRHCHTDHKGRKTDIVGLDRQTFNHELSDFALKGAHKAAACDSCHVKGKRLAEAPSKCVACHKKIEPHQGRLGEACEGCHGVEAWRPANPFDHSKTKFALSGAHKKVQCTTCHADERWKGIGIACIDCHRVGDVHNGRYGTKCETCHAREKWKDIHFDHDKATKFPLRGEHSKVTCEGCHSGDLYKDKLKTACVSCHKKQDAHQGQLGDKCERCHNEQGWRKKVVFDHDVTRFPLIGLHAAVPCESCHTSTKFQGTAKDCKSCHPDTHHEGRLGSACETCHNPNGWALWRFDHSKQTHFPLTGAHAGLNCHACHQQKHAVRLVIPSDCYSCHSSDDKHRGAFGRACATCHSTTSFAARIKRQ